MHRGKKYQDAVKLIEKDKNYPPDEAIALAKKTRHGQVRRDG